jgi:hypothetical protein
MKLTDTQLAELDALDTHARDARLKYEQRLEEEYTAWRASWETSKDTPAWDVGCVREEWEKYNYAASAYHAQCQRLSELGYFIEGNPLLSHHLCKYMEQT